MLQPTHPCLPIAHGFLYLVAILDLYSRRVMGWRRRIR